MLPSGTDTNGPLLITSYASPLAAAARAIQEDQDQFEQAVRHTVPAILNVRHREHQPVMAEPLATVAAQAAVNALVMKLSAVRQI
jgi:hypothetical protein